MFTSQIVKDRSGQHFIIRLRNQGQTNLAITPEKFHNRQLSYQFVTRLQAPFGLWHNIASSNSFFSLQRWQNSNPGLSIEHYGAEVLVQGVVEAYKFKHGIAFINSDRRFKTNGKVYQIAPAAYLLTQPTAQVVTFNRLEEARGLLSKLVTNHDQIAYLAENLELPIAMNSTATKG